MLVKDYVLLKKELNRKTASHDFMFEKNTPRPHTRLKYLELICFNNN